MGSDRLHPGRDHELGGADGVDCDEGADEIAGQVRLGDASLDGDDAGRTCRRETFDKLAEESISKLNMVLLRQGEQPDHLGADELRERLSLPPEDDGLLEVVEPPTCLKAVPPESRNRAKNSDPPEMEGLLVESPKAISADCVGIYN